jgi:hypothetical protein
VPPSERREPIYPLATLPREKASSIADSFVNKMKPIIEDSLNDLGDKYLLTGSDCCASYHLQVLVCPPWKKNSCSFQFCKCQSSLPCLLLTIECRQVLLPLNGEESNEDMCSVPNQQLWLLQHHYQDC